MSPETDKPYRLLGAIFMIVGALVLILALVNYLQDEKISLTVLIVFPVIFLGLLFYSRGKGRKGPGE